MLKPGGRGSLKASVFLVEWPGKGSDVDKVERSEDSRGGTGDSWPGRAEPANGPKGSTGALRCDTKMTLPLGKRLSCPVTGIQTTSLPPQGKGKQPFWEEEECLIPHRGSLDPDLPSSGGFQLPRVLHPRSRSWLHPQTPPSHLHLRGHTPEPKLQQRREEGALGTQPSQQKSLPEGESGRPALGPWALSLRERGLGCEQGVYIPSAPPGMECHPSPLQRPGQLLMMTHPLSPGETKQALA